MIQIVKTSVEIPLKEFVVQRPHGSCFYFATPYTKYPDGREQGALKASNLAGRLIEAGLNVFSPIAHARAIVSSSLCADDHKTWMRVDRSIAIGMRGLIVADMDGWQESLGVGIEIEWFRKWRTPKYFLKHKSMTLESFE